MPLLSDEVRDRLPWVQLAVESVLVVLSVLLALALNAWYQHVQEQKNVRRALQGIHAELLENKRKLEFRVANHRPTIDTLTTDSLSFQAPVSLHLINIDTQAWQTAQQMGAVGLMDYEIASRISAAYAPISELRFMSRKSWDILLDGTTFLGYTPEKLGDFGGFLNDLTNTEENTLKRIDLALEVIEARMPALTQSSSDSTVVSPTDAAAVN